MGWEKLLKGVDERAMIKGIEKLINDIKKNEFYDETVDYFHSSITGGFLHELLSKLLEGKTDVEEATIRVTLNELWYLKATLNNILVWLKYYPNLLKKVIEEYTKISSHPEWNSEMITTNFNFSIESQKIFQGIEEGKINETTPVKSFINLLADAPTNATAFSDIWTHINNAIEDLRGVYTGLSKKRSMGLFESMAESMGVKINYVQGRPTFKHGGLEFHFNGKGGLGIYGGNTDVNVCIVPTKPELPIGDYYATLLGLVVARPTELDVLDFAIRMANIFKEYNDYWGDFGLGAVIFTPFNKSNGENSEFVKLIEVLLNTEAGKYSSIKDTRPAGEMLEKIEKALIDVFGSTRGFF